MRRPIYMAFGVFMGYVVVHTIQPDTLKEFASLIIYPTFANLFTKIGIPLLYRKRRSRLLHFKIGGIMDWIITGMLMYAIWCVIKWKGWA